MQHLKWNIKMNAMHTELLTRFTVGHLTPMNIIKVLKKENSVAKVLHLNARGDSGGGTKRQSAVLRSKTQHEVQKRTEFQLLKK